MLFALRLYGTDPTQSLGRFPAGPEPLAGAGIYVNGQGQGISNIDGIFVLSELEEGDSIHSKFTGFENGGVRYSPGSSVEIFLHPQTIDEVEIVESSEGMRISERSIGLEMEMNQKELRRAACCNLSESFENNLYRRQFFRCHHGHSDH